MDKQSFRDMCAVYVVQGLVSGGGGSTVRSDVVSSKAFDIADAMADEREKRRAAERAKAER